MIKIVAFFALVAYVSARSSKIIGGDDVSPPGKWPWQGSLQYLGSHSCGCVLVDATHVLTAAHCAGSLPGAYTIYFGLHERLNTGASSVSRHTVSRISVHADFENSGIRGFPNDIAMITLAEPVVFDEFKQPATLPPDDNGSDPDYTRSECWITGWGRTTGGGPLPNVLQEVETKVISESACEVHWGARITRTHVCVHDPPNQTGACNGDSGGPLQCRNAAGDGWDLVGLTSWGASGCGTATPSVYTRVSFHLQWVRDNLGL